jgi:putative transposase
LLRRAEAGTAVSDLYRVGRVPIISATLEKWRSRFGGMGISMMTPMKEFAEENGRLKRLYI